VLHRPSVVFDQLKAAVFKLPVIDCHEHMGGPQFAESFREPIAALIFGYLGYDLVSAGAEPATWRLLLDQDVPTEKKWPIFEPLWQRVQHTAYARVTRLIMQRVYGVAEMSVTSLRCIGEQLAGRDEAYYWQVIEQANIRALVTDFLWFEPGDFGAYVAGEQTFPDRIRQTIPLPLFHVVQSVDTSLRKWEGTSSARDWPGVQVIAGWANRHITSLDEFLQAVFEVFCRAKARGAVGFKDVSAYMRSLHYDLPTRGEAERIFNRLLVDPRVVFGWPEARPLDDFLFHQYMRFARELDLPVQVHTGQLGGVYNRLDKANAALFGSVLELHRRVRFELLHANLPYTGGHAVPGEELPERGAQPDLGAYHRPAVCRGNSQAGASDRASQ
jgi:hypothetical protein